MPEYASDKEKITFPDRGSPERKELANILRQLNKWDEICDIDTLALDKIIKTGQWGNEILDQIKKFLNFDHKKQIFLSKLKNTEK